MHPNIIPPTATSMTQSKMGTLDWCESSRGRLSSAEKIILARNYAALKAETVFDEARYRLGFLNPAPVQLDSLAPPDTKLVKDADELARSVYNDVLWAHCLRTYYFGALVAAHDGIGFDPEIFYAAAICHDVGVNEASAGDVGFCCFAHSGGRYVFEQLVTKGHNQTAQRVGDAIAAHMNLVVPAGDYSEESTLVAVGATCDIFGTYVRRIAPSTLAETVERAPRVGLLEAFEPFLSKPHLEDSRTAVLVAMGAFETGGSHPIEKVLSKSNR